MLLEKMINAAGVSSREKEIRDLIKKEIEKNEKKLNDIEVKETKDLKKKKTKKNL